MPPSPPNSKIDVPLIFALDSDTLAVIFSGKVMLGMRVCTSWWKMFPVLLPMKVRLELVEGWPAHMQVISNYLTRFLDLSAELSVRYAKLAAHTQLKHLIFIGPTPFTTRFHNRYSRMGPTGAEELSRHIALIPGITSLNVRCIHLMRVFFHSQSRHIVRQCFVRAVPQPPTL